MLSPPKSNATPPPAPLSVSIFELRSQSHVPQPLHPVAIPTRRRVRGGATPRPPGSMASVDAADDPLLAASSPTRLLPRTLGPAAPTASALSPSRARGALLDGISRPLKVSKELVEQARLAMKERGNIQKLYQDDGVKVAAAKNGKNNQQGRRPALDRKRARFTIKAPTSNPVQNVDFSELLNIEDPEEYFLTLEQLEKADKEIKRLRGEIPTETGDGHRAIDPPKMRPGMLRRRSVHSYKFSAGADIPDATEAPASQIGIIRESQFTQDDVHASVPERTKQPVPSRSSQHAIPDISVIEDSFAEKDKGVTLDYLLSSFKNLDESEEENLLRKTLQLKEINIGKVCLPDFNVPSDMPVSSTTVRKNPMGGHTPERPVSGSHLARISQLEKHIFVGDVLKDKYADLSKDDESNSSPESVLGKQSLLHSSSDPVVLMSGEVSTARETASPCVKSPKHVLEPEPNIPNGVTTDERQPESSPLGVYRESGFAKEKDASSRHHVSLEEDDVPMDYPIIKKSNHETEDSSPHHLEGGLTEVLASTPGRNVSPLHGEDDNFEHQEVVGGGEVLQDMPIHPLEIPPEDIDPQNRSHMHDGNVEKLAVDISNALSPSKDNKQKAGQKGKNKKQPSTRRKRVADEPSHPLEIPPANFDSENQPHMQDINVEQQTVGTSNSQSPKKGKGQNEVQRRNKKKELDRRKSLSDAGLMWQFGVRRSTRIRSRPLQHWLGERFVYGRIHGTMATVIGVKSYSPTQYGKAAMRVKSFVPEQYSDIVAASAKY